MLLTLAALNIVFGIVDAVITRRRIGLFGLQIELNNLIRKVASKLGTEAGVIVGLILPCVAQSALCYLFGWQLILALLVGFRAKLFVMQVSSFDFEKELLAALKEAAKVLPPSSAASNTTPPSAASDTGVNAVSADAIGAALPIPDPTSKAS